MLTNCFLPVRKDTIQAQNPKLHIFLVLKEEYCDHLCRTLSFSYLTFGPIKKSHPRSTIMDMIFQPQATLPFSTFQNMYSIATGYVETPKYFFLAIPSQREASKICRQCLPLHCGDHTDTVNDYAVIVYAQPTTTSTRCPCSQQLL